MIIIPLVFLLFENLARKSQTPIAKPTAAPSKTTPVPKVSMQISTTELKSLNNGKNEWILNADKIEINEQTRQGEVKNVICNFFSEKGDLYVVLTAPGAKLDLISNNMEFTDGVKAKSVKNEYFEAEKLKYSGKDKIFIGTGNVKLIKGNSVIYGNKIIGIPLKRIIEIKGDVRANIKLKDF